jgi:hypothetical protein
MTWSKLVTSKVRRRAVFELLSIESRPRMNCRISAGDTRTMYMITIAMRIDVIRLLDFT